MFNFTVRVPEGGVVPLAIAPTDTVKMLKAAVGVKVEMAGFSLYAKHSDRPETLLKRDVDGTTLAEAGLKDGDALRVKTPSKPWTAARLAQWRVDRGITRVATSLNTGFKAVGDKVMPSITRRMRSWVFFVANLLPCPRGRATKSI
jgi:hypothetical protein